MTICRHEWPQKSGTVTCPLCRAVAFFDTEKDPFSESAPVILKPPEYEWKKLTHKVKHHIFEKCKNHIIIDVRKLGRKEAAKKWTMAESTLSQLLDAWEGKTKSEDVTPQSGLPALPPWDNNWMAPVQVKWLEIYGMMIQKQK